MSKELYFFYNGNPYKQDIFCSDALEIAGRGIWDSRWIKIKRTEVDMCNQEDIDTFFIEQCKEAIKLSLVGWTVNKAKELEEKGKQYLTKEWKYYLLECPVKVYKACQDGKYGIKYNLSIIQLPDELKMGNRPCSDGIVRDEKDYIRFLLGEDWSLIRLFMLKWPMLKFKYVDFSKADEAFPDIYCMVPFYDDAKTIGEIHNSLLL